MKSVLEISESKDLSIKINISLDRFENTVVFPEKLAKANQLIKKAGFPFQKKK